MYDDRIPSFAGWGLLLVFLPPFCSVSAGFKKGCFFCLVLFCEVSPTPLVRRALIPRSCWVRKSVWFVGCCFVFVPVKNRFFLARVGLGCAGCWDRSGLLGLLLRVAVAVGSFVWVFVFFCRSVWEKVIVGGWGRDKDLLGWGLLLSQGSGL